MNYYIFLPLAAAAINLGMAAYVAGLDWRNKLNRAFVYLSIMLIVWAVSDILLWSLSGHDTLYTISRIQSMIYTQSGIIMLHVIYQYMGRDYDLLYAYTLAICILSALIGISTEWMVADVKMAPWGAVLVPGPAYFPMALVGAILPSCAGLYLLARHMFTVAEVRERKRAALFMLGAFFGIFISFGFNLGLPFFFDVEMPSQTHIAGIVFQIFIFIAIIRYRMFRVDLPAIARELFTNAYEGVVLTQNQRIVELNAQAKKMIRPFINGPMNKALLSIIDTCRKQPAQSHELQTQAGEEDYVLSLSLLGVVDSDAGKGEILFISDISKQKNAERTVKRVNQDLEDAYEKAIQASLAKSQFLANMSHELRTPLNAIIGFSELALMNEIKDRELEESFKTIHDSGRHLLDLVNGLLDLSKIEAGKLELYIESFDMRGLIDNVFQVIEPLMQDNENSLIINCDEGLGEMHSDETKVRQILYNLLSNASKFTRQGEIRLSCSRVNGGLPGFELSVSDNGIGMTEEQQGKLFQAYQQADVTTSRKYGGTGLGLVISKRMCEMLGGEISVLSKPGEGTTFRLYLPADLTHAERIAGAH